MGQLKPCFEASGIDASGLSRAVSGEEGGALGVSAELGVGGCRRGLEADWDRRRGHPACLRLTLVLGLCCSPSTHGRGRCGQETEPALRPGCSPHPESRAGSALGYPQLQLLPHTLLLGNQQDGECWVLAFGSILALKEALFLADAVGLAPLSPEAVHLLCVQTRLLPAPWASVLGWVAPGPQTH